jgi:hypothetical protein
MKRNVRVELFPDISQADLNRSQNQYKETLENDFKQAHKPQRQKGIKEVDEKLTESSEDMLTTNPNISAKRCFTSSQGSDGVQGNAERSKRAKLGVGDLRENKEQANLKREDLLNLSNPLFQENLE